MARYHSPLLISLVAALAPSARVACGLSLNVSALSASDSESTLECWLMGTPFSISTEAGTAGSASLALGNLANLTYSVLPAAFDGGLHNAPRPQWVIFISGLAYVSLPTNSTSGAYIQGGEYGVVFAADTASVSSQGHRTQYPGTTETVVLEMPTEDGEIPAHRVLHSGACTASDIVGLRSLAVSSS